VTSNTRVTRKCYFESPFKTYPNTATWITYLTVCITLRCWTQWVIESIVY